MPVGWLTTRPRKSRRRGVLWAGDAKKTATDAARRSVWNTSDAAPACTQGKGSAAQGPRGGGFRVWHTR